MISRVFAGGSEGLTRDDVLDNITLAWLTNTGVSGGRLYWENKGASFFAVKGVKVPTAVSVFPDELYPAPRSWAERAYPQTDPLQQARQGRPLCGLGAAETLLRGGSRRLEITAQLQLVDEDVLSPQTIAIVPDRGERLGTCAQLTRWRGHSLIEMGFHEIQTVDRSPPWSYTARFSPDFYFQKGAWLCNAETKTSSSDKTALRAFRVEFWKRNWPICAGALRPRGGRRRRPSRIRRRACRSRRSRTSRATGRRTYDWRKCEAKLNALPQFITEIDGLDIHFIHVRSKQRARCRSSSRTGGPVRSSSRSSSSARSPTPPPSEAARRTLSTS